MPLIPNFCLYTSESFQLIASRHSPLLVKYFERFHSAYINDISQDPLRLLDSVLSGANGEVPA